MKKLSRYRRHPAALLALILVALVATGAVYSVASNVNQAKAEDKPVASASDVAEGQKLFVANCASCHGLNAEGGRPSENMVTGPSLIGVGAAAVDFQVGTGRMPAQMQGPQIMAKPTMFTQKQTEQLSAYVASLGAGPAIPSEADLDLSGADLGKGGEVFRVNCAMCHNAAAAGGALTQGKFAPELAGVSEKHIYEAMVTGPQNMPVFSDMNVTPENKKDLIAYLKALEDQGSAGGFSLGSLGPVSEGLFIWTFGLTMVIGFTIWLTKRSS